MKYQVDIIGDQIKNNDKHFKKILFFINKHNYS